MYQMVKGEIYTLLCPAEFNDIATQRKGEIIPIRVLKATYYSIPEMKYRPINMAYLLDMGEMQYVNPQNIVSVRKECRRVSDHVLEGDTPY